MFARRMRLEGMTKTTLDVSGMTCSSCVAHVTDALSIQGVGAIDVQLSTGRLVVQHAPTIPVGRLIAALQAAGYDASPSTEARVPAVERKPSCCG